MPGESYRKRLRSFLCFCDVFRALMARLCSLSVPPLSLSHTHTRTHTHTHAHARTHTHTHARTHARTHTHTHTYTPLTYRRWSCACQITHVSLYFSKLLVLRKVTPFSAREFIAQVPVPQRDGIKEFEQTRNFKPFAPHGNTHNIRPQAGCGPTIRK